MHLDSEVVDPGGYPKQFHPLRPGRLRVRQTRRTTDAMSQVGPNTQSTPYLHNLKLPLYFIVVSVTFERLP